jgi:hypothetical protein
MRGGGSGELLLLLLLLQVRWCVQIGRKEEEEMSAKRLSIDRPFNYAITRRDENCTRQNLSAQSIVLLHGKGGRGDSQAGRERGERARQSLCIYSTTGRHP